MMDPTELAEDREAEKQVPKPGDAPMNYPNWIRDYFAAAVLQGEASLSPHWGKDVTDEVLATRCRLYYRIADAMLIARQ